MKVLIIEDDQKIAKSLSIGLKERSYFVDLAFDGEKGLNLALENYYDLLIIDKMLPKMDGFSIIKAIRDKDITTPILMLTAATEVDDKVSGFTLGCDDYLTKPFAFPELLVRIRALTKRQANSSNTLTIDDLVIDKIKRKAHKKGENILLNPKEFDLLVILASHKNETIPRERLLKDVWNLDFDPQTNVVDVHISRLRQKVDKAFDTQTIKTVRGLGYTLLSKGS